MSEKKESAAPWVALGIIVAMLFLGILFRGYLFGKVITRELISTCTANFNAHPKLDENFDANVYSLSDIRFLSGAEARNLQEADVNIEYLKQQLSTTNKQYNKLETLVACLFDQH